MSSVKKQLIKNTCSGWVAQLSAAAVGFIILPYNLQYLGKDVYGISVIAVTVIAMLQFLNLGMGPALLRFFSQAIAKNDKDELEKISSTSQLILGGLGVIGAVVIFAGIPWFLRFYEIAPENHHETKVLLFCLAISFFLSFHSMVFTGIVLASNRYDAINLNGVISSWLRMGLLVIFYNVFIPSLIWLGAAILISGIYSYLTVIGLSFHNQGKAILFSAKKVTLSWLPVLFSFSFLSLINSVFFSASIHVPLLIIGKTLGKETATLFYPAILVATYLFSILAQICNPLTPIAAQDQVNAGGKNIGRWAILFGQIISCVGYGCIFAAVVFMPDVLRIWLGNDFVDMSLTVTVLTIGVVYASIQGVNYNLALGANTIAPIAYSSVVMAILTSLGALLGTLYWNWGLLEVALCITIVRVLRNTFFLSWIYSKIFNYSFRDYFFKVYIKPAMAGIPLLALIYIIKHTFLMSQVGLLLLILEIFVTALLYMFVTWFGGFSMETRSFLLKRRQN